MKALLTAAAALAILAGAGPVSAQIYQPMTPPPMQPLPPAYVSETPSWMQDDGASSDYPIHNPGDFSGNRLNSEYQGGLSVAPPSGLPAPYWVR